MADLKMFSVHVKLELMYNVDSALHIDLICHMTVSIQ